MPLKKKTPKAVGFKLFPDHFTRKNQFVMQQLLADSRVKANESHIVSAVEGFIIRHVVSCLMCCVILQKIVLRRENYLGVYISKLRADKTGHYLNKSLDDVAVHVDPSAFQCFLEYYDQVYEFHYVTYEELANDHTSDVAIKDVLRFLGVDDRVAPPALDLTIKQVLPLMTDELL